MIKKFYEKYIKIKKYVIETSHMRTIYFYARNDKAAFREAEMHSCVTKIYEDIDMYNKRILFERLSWHQKYYEWL